MIDKGNLIDFCISGLTIKINAPEWAIHENFYPFICDNGNHNISYNVVLERPESAWKEKARFFLKHSGVSFFDLDDCIYILNHNNKSIPSLVKVSADWLSQTVFIDPSYNLPKDDGIVQTVRTGLFSVIQKTISPPLANIMGLMIHSSTIIWDGRGIMFAASSGTGKTTHTNMWKRLYGVEILDGDITACRVIDNAVLAYGLPWCGTSGEYSNRCVPLGAIVFLQQSDKNSIRKIDDLDAVLRLSSQAFILPLNETMTNIYLGVIQEIVRCTNCYLLSCLPDENAVEIVKKCLT